MPTAFWGGEQERDDFDINNCCSLSRTQRLYGFGICFIGGFLISFLSTILLTAGSVGGFAVLYTIGNVVAICSTMFLVGPMSHVKRMFDATRLVATCVYLGTIVLTLVIAFTIGTIPLIIVLVFVQFFAGIWYSLSYIPFARQAVINCFKSWF